MYLKIYLYNDNVVRGKGYGKYDWAKIRDSITALALPMSGPALYVSGSVLQIPILIILGGIGVLVAFPFVGSIPVYHVLGIFVAAHLKIHRDRVELYEIDPNFENPLPSFKKMALSIFTGTLGILSFLISGGGLLPLGVIDVREDITQFLITYVIASTVAVSVNYALWLLESTGATCKEPGLGKVNIGRLASIVFSGFLGLAAILHYAQTFFDMWDEGTAVQAGLILMPLLAAAGACFVAFFIKVLFFERQRQSTIYYAKSNVRYYLIDRPARLDRKRPV